MSHQSILRSNKTMVLVLLIVSILTVSTDAIRSIHNPAVGSFKSRLNFGLSRGGDQLLAQSTTATTVLSSACLDLPRGGSEATAEDKDDDEDDDAKSSNSKSKIASVEPITLLIKTNLNNKVVDIQSIEIMALRVRNIESIKKTLSRQLPGKPPLESIRLMQHGQVLREELLIDELMDDDDEDDEDDDDENKPALTLVLDMVPPVDPRSFSGGLLQENMNAASTADLLEAYALNEAAIWYASQSLEESTAVAEVDDEDGEAKVIDDDDEEATTAAVDSSPSPLISFQLRQYATTLKSQLQQNALSEKALALLDDPIPPAQAAAELAQQPQVRGQRLRPAAALVAGGVPSSSVVGLKQTAQHFLNINWGDTIRNFCLFLFFGWFGGRTVMSRAVLLLGAPLCFVVQARPVKLYFRELIYIVLRNPPGIILSLLPAPQQAMLSCSDDEAMRLIYGNDAPQMDEGGVDDNDDVNEDTENDVPEWDEEEDDDEEEDSYDDEDADSDEDY